VVHAYVHDTDLLDRRRRLALSWVLRVLARRARATDLDALATSLDAAPAAEWSEVAQPS
jgi:hypothetical protein